MKLFKSPHTWQSIAATLADGLEDGTLILKDSTEPTLPPEVAAAVEDLNAMLLKYPTLPFDVRLVRRESSSPAKV